MLLALLMVVGAGVSGTAGGLESYNGQLSFTDVWRRQSVRNLVLDRPGSLRLIIVSGSCTIAYQQAQAVHGQVRSAAGFQCVTVDSLRCRKVVDLLHVGL